VQAAATGRANQSFTLQLLQAMPVGSQPGSTNAGSPAVLHDTVSALQQLRQMLATNGTAAALPVTIRSFGGATAGQSLSNTGDSRMNHWGC
jgi:hypothetical protein